MVKSLQKTEHFMTNHIERFIDSIIEREARSNTLFCLVKMGVSKAWIAEEKLVLLLQRTDAW